MTSPVEHIVEKWMHVREATGGNDGADVLHITRGDKVPWCAAMILRAIEAARWPKPPCSEAARQHHGDRWGWYYENRLVESFEHNMLSLVGGEVTGRDEAGPNDLVFYADRAGSDDPTLGASTHRTGKPQRHVDIVERVEHNDANRTVILHVIGGNLGNAVKRRVISIDDPRITSICRLQRP